MSSVEWFFTSLFFTVIFGICAAYSTRLLDYLFGKTATLVRGTRDALNLEDENKINLLFENEKEKSYLFWQELRDKIHGVALLIVACFFGLTALIVVCTQPNILVYNFVGIALFFLSGVFGMHSLFTLSHAYATSQMLDKVRQLEEAKFQNKGELTQPPQNKKEIE